MNSQLSAIAAAMAVSLRAQGHSIPEKVLRDALAGALVNSSLQSLKEETTCPSVIEYSPTTLFHLRLALWLNHPLEGVPLDDVEALAFAMELYGGNIRGELRCSDWNSEASLDLENYQVAAEAPPAETLQALVIFKKVVTPGGTPLKAAVVYDSQEGWKLPADGVAQLMRNVAALVSFGKLNEAITAGWKIVPPRKSAPSQAEDSLPSVIDEFDSSVVIENIIERVQKTDFVMGYVTCALSTADFAGGAGLRNIESSSLVLAYADCEAFVRTNQALLDVAGLKYPDDTNSASHAKYLGQDLWMSRSGFGGGFLNRFDRKLGTQLHVAANTLGACSLVLGGDSLLHFEAGDLEQSTQTSAPAP